MTTFVSYLWTVFYLNSDVCLMMGGLFNVETYFELCHPTATGQT